MNLNPSLGRKLNPDGLSPLHVALRENSIETAIALVRIDKQLVRVKGKAGFTPLHFAVKINTCLDVVARFLLDCPDSIDDLNNRRSRENVVGWRDDKGNTALHVAVQYDCVQVVKTMLNIAKLNKRNSEGKTALDIAEDHKEEIAKVLKKAGARRARELPLKQPLNQYLLSQPTYMENLVRGFHFMIADLTNDMRNVVLVVAALIATATYQAVLQPPGGLYQGNGDADDTGSTSRIALAAPASSSSSPKHAAGKMVMTRPVYYNQFMPANTVAFTLSMLCHRHVLHIRFERRFRYHVHRVVVRDRAAYAAKMSYYVVKALFVDVWWLRGCPDAAWYGPTFFIE
ncbi:hypothetical protein DH2020_028866 [Rehmannia glutinosa]|uniref:PGG domain-containing protein n=1 Tax=Rehmannia glutinosa TaxID=99300 RepID=A0ABR0VR51_REHGL